MSQLETWLQDKGSVSEKLTEAFGQPVIDVLSASWCSNTPYANAFVRRVWIYVKQQPFMYAESYLPELSLTEHNAFFLNLGRGILGHHLFGQSQNRRLDMEHGLTRLNALPGCQTLKGVCPSRFSSFSLNESPFYLHEYFLPSLVDAIDEELV